MKVAEPDSMYVGSSNNQLSSSRKHAIILESALSTNGSAPLTQVQQSNIIPF